MQSSEHTLLYGQQTCSGKHPDPVLRCTNGHPAVKLKKLKPWQGRLNESFFCNLCGHTLDREDFRWRCDQHCNWNACRGCYDVHWFQIVRTASQETDKQIQAKMLGAVPLLWREQNKDAADAVWRANVVRQATSAGDRRGSTCNEKGAVNGKVETGEESREPTVDAEGDRKWPSVSASKLRDFEVVAWLFVAAVSTGAAAQAATILLRGDDEEPELPHPWMLLGLSHVGSALLCTIAAFCLGSAGADQTAGGAAAEIGLKEYTILGFMYGVEHGIGAIVLRRRSLDACAEAYMLNPFFMLLAGVLAGIEHPRREFLFSIGTVALGGLLMTRLSLDLAGLWRVEHLVILANIIATFRWVFTRNVLPATGAPLVGFAMKMLPTAAALGFELAFVSDFSSYPALLMLRNPGRVAGLLLLISLCMAAALIAELHVAHFGLTPLGFLGPLRLLLGLCLAVANGSHAVDHTRLLGNVVCMAGVAIYCWQLQREDLTRDLPPGIVPLAQAGRDPDGGYLRLSAGGSEASRPGRLPASTL